MENPTKTPHHERPTAPRIGGTTRWSVSALALGVMIGGFAMGGPASVAAATADTTVSTTTTVRSDATLSEEAGEAWASFKSYSADRRDDAVAAGERVLSAIDRQLDALGEKMEDASDEAKQAWRDRHEKLAAARESFADSLATLRDGAADGWDATKDKMSDAYDSIADGVSDAWRNLKS